MPNHVHALIEPINGWEVAKIVATWKKFTAYRINAHLAAKGQKTLHPFWHREYWDRFMRDERHFEQTVAYIHNNPVKGGLVSGPEQVAVEQRLPRERRTPFGERLRRRPLDRLVGSSEHPGAPVA